VVRRGGGRSLRGAGLACQLSGRIRCSLASPRAQPAMALAPPLGVLSLWHPSSKVDVPDLAECFGSILPSWFHSYRYINGRQHYRCNSQWTSEQRGRCSVVGKVCTKSIGRLPVSECGRLVAGTLNESVTKLREDNDTRMSQYVHTQPPEWRVLIWCYRRITAAFQEELLAFREGEQERLAQLVVPYVSKESSPV